MIKKSESAKVTFCLADYTSFVLEGDVRGLQFLEGNRDRTFTPHANRSRALHRSIAVHGSGGGWVHQASGHVSLAAIVLAFVRMRLV